MFKYLLRLPDGEPPDPAMFVTAVPTWSVGDIVTVGRREQFRVVAIDGLPHAEFVEQGINVRPLTSIEEYGAEPRRCVISGTGPRATTCSQASG